MGYRLKLDQAIDEGLRRIANEQFAAAHRVLVEAADAEVAVHSSRKAIKRLRSLLILVKPGITKSHFKRENCRLRDISRSLSARRDRDVLVASLAKLMESCPRDQAGAGRVRQWLVESQEPIGAEAYEGAGLAPTLEELKKARGSFKAVVEEVKDFKVLAAGVAAAYDACQKAHQTVLVSPGVEHNHELRKRVQRHWRHMQILAPLWPSVLKARVQLAREVSELLGSEHDLAMAVSFIESRSAKKADEKLARRLLGIAAEQQDEMCKRALARTEVLLAGEAGEWVRVLPIYFSAARCMAEEAKTTTLKV